MKEREEREVVPSWPTSSVLASHTPACLTKSALLISTHLQKYVKGERMHSYSHIGKHNQCQYLLCEGSIVE